MDLEMAITEKLIEIKKELQARIEIPLMEDLATRNVEDLLDRVRDVDLRAITVARTMRNVRLDSGGHWLRRHAEDV